LLRIFVPLARVPAGPEHHRRRGFNAFLSDAWTAKLEKNPKARARLNAQRQLKDEKGMDSTLVKR